MELIEIEESLKGECCGLGNPIYCEASENQIATNLLRENVKAYPRKSVESLWLKVERLITNDLLIWAHSPQE
jgi:hypothetical protein